MAITDEMIGRIVQGFATAALDPAQWWPALTLMSDEMGSASSSLELADINTGAASINCTFPMDDNLVQQYEERIYHIKLKRLLADSMLDNAALKDLLTKKW